VDADDTSIVWRGELQDKANTDDGVLERENRRVEIIIE
jgi:outer membrane protein OmpA-like peptidoglycan-associated protein|tara:strand:+ start:497 stop:610 length:114 start_codon:yes stop_codon:yes gene_type:complete